MSELRESRCGGMGIRRRGRGIGIWRKMSIVELRVFLRVFGDVVVGAGALLSDEYRRWSCAAVCLMAIWLPACAVMMSRNQGKVRNEERRSGKSWHHRRCVL